MILAGAIHSIRRRGNRGTFVVIEDHTTRLELSLFDESWALYGDKLVKDEIIVVEGKVSANSFSGGCRMSVQKIRTLSEAKTEFARGVRISMRGADVGVTAALESAFLPYRRGTAAVVIDYANARARARLQLGDEWKLKPCEELVAALSEVDGVSEVRLTY